MKKIILSLIAITSSIHSMDQDQSPSPTSHKRPRYITRSQTKNGAHTSHLPGFPTSKRQKLNHAKKVQTLCYAPHEEFELIVPMEDVIMNRTKSPYHTSDFAIHQSLLLVKKNSYLNQNQLDAKIKEIKLRFFNNFIDRYNYNYNWTASPTWSIQNYSDLKINFLRNNLNPHHPIHLLLLEEYAETMSEWNSNF